MIVEPDQRVADFAKAGSDIISVHCEQSATIHLHRLIGQVRALHIDGTQFDKIYMAAMGCEGIYSGVLFQCKQRHLGRDCSIVILAVKIQACTSVHPSQLLAELVGTWALRPLFYPRVHPGLCKTQSKRVSWRREGRRWW